MASIWLLYHTGLTGGLLRRGLSFWRVLLSPQRKPLGSDNAAIRFLVTSLTEAVLQFRWQPAPGRFLLVQNYFYWQMMEATVLIGTFRAAEMFLYLPQICASSPVGHFIHRCVSFQLISNQLNWPQVDSSEAAETSEVRSVETGWTCASCQRLWTWMTMGFLSCCFFYFNKIANI